MAAEFRVLGQIEALTDGHTLDIGHARQRSVLAVLLIEANRVVALDQLQERIWGTAPAPRDPRSVLRTYLWHLRRALAVAGDVALVRHAPGYKLVVDERHVDLHRFRDLLAEARTADGDDDRAAALLDEALGLWRGEPFAGLDTPWISDVRTALIAQRHAARLDLTEIRLRLGQHAAVLPGLTAQAAEHSLDERMAGQLMLACYRSGRQADALAHYEKLRRQLAEELGTDPGPPLQRLHQQILTADPELASHAAATAPVPGQPALVPHQIPPDVSHFTGRAAELHQLEALLGTSGAELPATVVITAVSGTPGVGKTALAVRWAHQVASRFPDGQLYASLRGHAAAGPADPLAVLARFLRELGVVSARIPGDLDEAAVMYRSLLDGRRVLIVLDNAASSGQVRPLLPGTSGCAVIVTSRSRLPGLGARDGAAQVSLAPFRPDEAATLLRAILGAHRADAEPAAVAAIAAECAYLPLALRIAAERAIAHPHQTLASLAAQLTAARSRLDVLAADDDPATSVRTVFSWSYQALPEGTARMFRLLGLHPGPDISVPAAAVLAATDTAEAQRLLDALAGAHLLEETAAGRYRFHDLLRAYAAERAAADESPADRAAALRRILTWYLHTADAADRLLASARRHLPLDPPPPQCKPLPLASYDQALAWCDAEHASIVACVRCAAATGHDDIAWQLTVASWSYSDLRKPWAEWIACARIALSAARRCGDRFGQAWVLSGLAGAYRALRQFSDALECGQQSLQIRRDIGDRSGEASVLNNLGTAYCVLEKFDDGLRCFQQALAIARETKNRYSEVIGLNNLGEAYRILGRFNDAISCHQQVLDLARAMDHPRNEALALHSLGESYRAIGEPGIATDYFRRALSVFQRIGDRHGQAQTLRDLGDLLHELRETGAARALWQQALAIFEELGNPHADELRARMHERRAGS